MHQGLSLKHTFFHKGDSIFSFIHTNHILTPTQHHTQS